VAIVGRENGVNYTK